MMRFKYYTTKGMRYFKAETVDLAQKYVLGRMQTALKRGCSEISSRYLYMIDEKGNTIKSWWTQTKDNEKEDIQANAWYEARIVWW